MKKNKNRFKLLSAVGVVLLINFIMPGNSYSGTVYCPEAGAKCTITRTDANGNTTVEEDEKGSKRGAIEIEE